LCSADACDETDRDACGGQPGHREMLHVSFTTCKGRVQSFDAKRIGPSIHYMLLERMLDARLPPAS
jgi:hypothetical protein